MTDHNNMTTRDAVTQAASTVSRISTDGMGQRLTRALSGMSQNMARETALRLVAVMERASPDGTDANTAIAVVECLERTRTNYDQAGIILGGDERNRIFRKMLDILEERVQQGGAKALLKVTQPLGFVDTEVLRVRNGLASHRLMRVQNAQKEMLLRHGQITPPTELGRR